MKIVYVKLTNGYADHLTYQENILPARFVSLGHETHVITMPRFTDIEGRNYIKEPCVYKNDKGLYIHVLPFSKKCKPLSIKFDYYESLGRILESLKPEFIFSHGVQYASLITLAKYKKRHPEVKLIADNHGDFVIMPINTISRWIVQKIVYRYIVLRAKNEIDCFYGVSPSRAAYLSKVYGVPTEKIKVIPQVGDDTIVNKYVYEEERKLICERFNIKRERIIVAFGAGNIDKKKNVISLARALFALDGCALVIFGTFAPEIKTEMEEIISKSGNIFYMGRLSGEDIYKTIIGSDLMIFPGQHSVLWDNSVACGTPLCVKHWDGMDYFNINGNCLYLEDGSSDEIKQVIEDVLNSGKLEHMRKLAQGEAKEYFSATSIAKHILEDIQ